MDGEVREGTVVETGRVGPPSNNLDSLRFSASCNQEHSIDHREWGGGRERGEREKREGS